MRGLFPQGVRPVLRILCRPPRNPCLCPFPSRPLKAQGHGFVTLKSSFDLPKVRLFRDWLFGELEACRQWEERYLASL